MARRVAAKARQKAEAAVPETDAAHLVRLAASAVGDRVHFQFEALDADLGQVRSILNSASENLSGTFTGLQQETIGQQEILRSLVEELVSTLSGPEHDQQTAGIDRLSREADEVVRRVIALFRTAHESAGKVSLRFGRILSQFDAAVGELHQAGAGQALERQIAVVTAELALQAQEGAEQGPGTPAFEIRKLIRDVQKLNDCVSAQIERLESAIGQVNEAVDSIPHPDLVAAEASRQAMGGIWRQMQELNERVVGKSEHVGRVSQRIHEHVCNGVVSLQFEDIAGQLIEHVRRRGAACQDAFSRLSDALAHCADVTAMESVLRSLDAELDQSFGRLAHKAVSQTTVDTGSVDLF